MPEVIVTHRSPDLDALASVWLLHRFKPRWKNAEVMYVPAGQTLHDMDPDESPSIIHVDTGGGQYDHHDTSDFTCAARLVSNDLIENEHIANGDIEPIDRIVDVITRYDHFKESMLPKADDDMHLFSLAYIIAGLRSHQNHEDKLVEMAEYALDGILMYMKGVVNAEKVMEKGHSFTSYWGKTLVVISENDKVFKVAFKKGYDMVVRYSKRYNNVSIKVHPRVRRKLSKLYKKLTKDDPNAQWFYHASGRLLINASRAETRDKVTKYSLKEIMRFIKSF